MAENKLMHTNRLAKEKSPYLLQHAHNPVDWYPWGEDAFARAKREDKPVFLSIGYSTCHWCHVMEEESFENERTAELLNKHFVAIKVDREERPDIDHVYMDYVMATTGSGGWPMTVFLTPDKKPFYGGTYFPPEDRYGMPGLGNLLSSIAEAWKNRRDEILKSADSATAFLARKGVGARSPRPKGGETPPLPDGQTLKTAFERFAATFDSERGGFGRAPKFPRSHTLSFLLRYWLRSGDTAALEMAEKTLTAMAGGGMYDQLGGGFHRYSTDAQWRVPHFEKMLYDQALLSRTYLEAYQATHNVLYSRIAREILDYVLREMTDPQEGGFYSAEDADSPDPANPSKKREGAYFVWTKEEIVGATPASPAGRRASPLPPDAAEIFCHYFGVEQGGNALEDPHHEFTGQNVLYAAHSVEETAAHFKLGEGDVEKIIREGKSRLFELRLKRPPPGLDDKILTDWNGLMISSFAFGSRVLNEPRYRDAAVRAGEFVKKHLMADGVGARPATEPAGRQAVPLQHRYREGEAAIPAHLNDYAFLIYGLLDLYEATFDVKWLVEARDLAGTMTDLFWDEAHGGFFLTAKNAEALIARPKEIYDGAVPSGNSLAALDLLRLERMTGDGRFKRFAADTLAAFAGEVSAEPTGYPQFLIALDFAIGPSSEIVLASRADDAQLEPFVREVYSKFIPNKIVMFHPSGKENVSIENLAPFLKNLTPMDGRPIVFVCRNYACSLPVTDVPGLKKILNKERESTG